MKRLWNNACEAYWWVYHHPELQNLGSSPWIEITPHKVNPSLLTDGHATVDDDPNNNTTVEFWVEAGIMGYYPEVGWYRSNDYELECGGWTWEEAVLNLAQLVLNKYGSY